VWFIFVAILGAIVGSFLNVVIYRVPAGLSVFSPARSFCPNCKTELAWYDNIPILGWFVLGGKCRYCKCHISFQYPLIEAINTLLFAGLFVAYFFTTLRPDLSENGLEQCWPVFVMHLILLASMLAATVIDSRLYIIPLSIPWTVTLATIVVYPLAVALKPTLTGVQSVDARGLGLALGGMVGLGIAVLLLETGVLPTSFAEPAPDESKGDSAKSNAAHLDASASPEQEAAGPLVAALPSGFFVHANPRLEVLKELLFVSFPLAGMIAGAYIMPNVWALNGGNQALSQPLSALGAVLWGYLLGGGLIWGTRIIGTLMFGKEAMGLGDVHFLAAIGAVLGAPDAALVFFIAPFLGLGYAAVTAFQRLVSGQMRVIPYGPYLAVATVIVMVFKVPILRKLGILG
jgi:leader peptidase (prepilin peptidase) / N-methyltransferase